MKIVVALDSFNGCLTSQEANQAAAVGIKGVCPEAEIVQVPVSDGGEGFTAAFHAAIGGELVEVMVKDPMMRNIKAKYLLHDGMAVIEVAQACGLDRVDQDAVEFRRGGHVFGILLGIPVVAGAACDFGQF